MNCKVFAREKFRIKSHINDFNQIFSLWISNIQTQSILNELFVVFLPISFFFLKIFNCGVAFNVPHNHLFFRQLSNIQFEGIFFSSFSSSHSVHVMWWGRWCVILLWSRFDITWIKWTQCGFVCWWWWWLMISFVEMSSQKSLYTCQAR